MSTAAQPDDPYAAMLRGPLVPTLVVGAVAAGAAYLLQGTAGLLGALLAAVVVILFFSASLLVMSRTARTAPQNVMAIALVMYITKVGLLGLLLVLLMDAPWLSGDAFALTALACAAVWLPLEIVAYSRARTLIYDEPESAA